MTKTTDRCTGNCCRCFTIPYSPHEVQASYWAWLRGGAQVSQMGSDNSPILQDIHILAPMLVYLGLFDRHPKQAKQINPMDEVLLRGRFDVQRHFYRCKHFDEKEKICTIYEMRPVMCRSYPNGRPCNYSGCTWRKMRARKQTKAQLAKRLRLLQEKDAEPTDPGGKD